MSFANGFTFETGSRHIGMENVYCVSVIYGPQQLQLHAVIMQRSEFGIWFDGKGHR